MQYQFSNTNASTTIRSVNSNRASARPARFAETAAPCAMQFKKIQDFSNSKSEASELIRLVETALQAAVQRSTPRDSSGAGSGDRQVCATSQRTPSVGAQRFRKSRVIAKSR